MKELRRFLQNFFLRVHMLAEYLKIQNLYNCIAGFDQRGTWFESRSLHYKKSLLYYKLFEWGLTSFLFFGRIS